MKKPEVTIGNYKRWRLQRGIKLTMAIVPIENSKNKRAVCEFEGDTYIGQGKTHSIALDNCMKLVKKYADLNN